jgi:hypothetical protein
MNIPQIEYVEELHALLIEKHMEIQVGIALCIDESQLEIQVGIALCIDESQLEIQVGITLCIDKSQLEIQVVSKKFEEIFWTFFSNKDWEYFGNY